MIYFPVELCPWPIPLPRLPRDAFGSLLHRCLASRRSFQCMGGDFGRQSESLHNNDGHQYDSRLRNDAPVDLHPRNHDIRKCSTPSALQGDIHICGSFGFTTGHRLFDTEVSEKSGWIHGEDPEGPLFLSDPVHHHLRYSYKLVLI